MMMNDDGDDDDDEDHKDHLVDVDHLHLAFSISGSVLQNLP